MTLQEIINNEVAEMMAITASINERTQREHEIYEAWAEMLQEANAEYADILD